MNVSVDGGANVLMHMVGPFLPNGILTPPQLRIPAQQIEQALQEGVHAWDASATESLQKEAQG